MLKIPQKSLRSTESMMQCQKFKGKESTLWGWRCGVVGKTTACSASIPHGCRFKSQLLRS